jgi:hypothetical protein
MMCSRKTPVEALAAKSVTKNLGSSLESEAKREIQGRKDLYLSSSVADPTDRLRNHDIFDM